MPVPRRKLLAAIVFDKVGSPDKEAGISTVAAEGTFEVDEGTMHDNSRWRGSDGVVQDPKDSFSATH